MLPRVTSGWPHRRLRRIGSHWTRATPATAACTCAPAAIVAAPHYTLRMSRPPTLGQHCAAQSRWSSMWVTPCCSTETFCTAHRPTSHSVGDEPCSFITLALVAAQVTAVALHHRSGSYRHPTRHGAEAWTETRTKTMTTMGMVLIVLLPKMAYATSHTTGNLEKLSCWLLGSIMEGGVFRLRQ